MSNRVVTDQQFSEGTTIDGNRIEDGMQDVERFLDKVPQEFVRRRFVENQIVSGFSPVPGKWQSDANPPGIVMFRHPWLWHFNSDSANPENITNKRRLKGYGLTGKYFWTQSVQFARPVIIDSFNLVMAHDLGTGSGSSEADDQQYKMGTTSYPNYVPPNINDFELHITIDNIHTPEDRSQNSMEVHKHKFSGASCLIRPYVATGSEAPVNDMSPAVPGGGLSGYAVVIPDLNIPLHAHSRARFVIVIPYYSKVADQVNWTAFPWSTSVWNQSVGILEANQNV